MPWIRPPQFPPLGPVVVGPALDPLPLLAPSFAPLTNPIAWRQGWTHIVAGKFSDSKLGALCCYDQWRGVLEFWETDGLGYISRLKQYEGWSRPWTHVVAGRFSDSPYDGLLFYDQGAGLAAQYACQGGGELVELGIEDFWRPSWNIIVAGRFSDSPYDGLLLYDRSAGLGAFYATTGHGHTELLAEHYDWRKTWTAIVPGNWGADDWSPPEKTDLFFYEGETGYGETYFCNTADELMQVGGQAAFPLDARVLAGNFGGSGWSNLIFLDQALSRGQVWYAASAPGEFPAREGEPDPHDHRSFRPDAHALTWLPVEALDLEGQSFNHVAAANFWVADPEDVLFDEGGFTDLAFYATKGFLRFYLKEPPPQPLDSLMGYPSRSSAQPGESLTFHLSSTIGPVTLEIYRLGGSDQHMTSLQVGAGAWGPHPIARNAWRDGAGWPVAATLQVPSNWPSGLYVARIVADPLGGPVGDAGDMAARRSAGIPPVPGDVGATVPSPRPQSRPTYDIPFVVRPAQSSAHASILVGVPDTTYEAYNFWGGRSFYTGGAGGSAIWVDPYSRFKAPRGFRVSFRRGFRSLDPRAADNRKWKVWEVPFLAWLERHGITVDLCAMSDLHHDPSILQGYRLFVSIGHDEYWSRPMRTCVEQHVFRGGNVAFLSGNTCYWQIRFEGDGDRMVCYKHAELDPLAATDGAHATILWTDPPVNYSERLLTGVSGANLYDPETIVFDPKHPESIRVYTVVDATHWVFHGTDLANGQVFGLYLRPDGQIRTALGSETDVRATESMDTFRRLAAMYDGSGGVAGEMVIREHQFGGTVFSAATIDWVLGLMSDELYPAISQITLNVLRRLGGI